jgi:sulfatase modifying factor 1
MWHGDDAKRAPVGDFPPPWASAWGDDVYGLWADLTVNGVTQRMRWIEPSGPEGFWMGSTQQERDVINDQNVREWANQAEHEPTCVPIKQGFWLADTPCTQAFWQAVTGENPSHFSKGPDAPERPVESVNWNDVDEQFVQRFAQTPAWGTGDRLCLPSEEEWEYAARAGTRSAYWWGDAWDATRGNANVAGERRWDDKEGTTPVRRYAPNPWGLFDVHGNVWEWCSSPWRPRLDAPEARPDEERRVVRGGSWVYRPGYARAACRIRRPRRYAIQHQGFRFALRSPAGPEAR